MQAQLVGKIGDDEHDIPSYVRKGKIQAIINTVGTKRTADEDGEQIRRSAIEHGVPLFTALDTADAMLKVLESRSFVTESHLNKKMILVRESFLFYENDNIFTIIKNVIKMKY